MALTQIVSSFEESGDRPSALVEPSHEERFFVGREKEEVIQLKMMGSKISEKPKLSSGQAYKLAEVGAPKDATHFCVLRVADSQGDFCYHLIRYYSV